MYEQKRREVNKAYEKYEKQLKAAKTSGKNAKANAEKVGFAFRVAAGAALVVHGAQGGSVGSLRPGTRYHCWDWVGPCNLGLPNVLVSSANLRTCLTLGAGGSPLPMCRCATTLPASRPSATRTAPTMTRPEATSRSAGVITRCSSRSRSPRSCRRRSFS